jgi:hypothetical protein
LAFFHGRLLVMQARGDEGLPVSVDRLVWHACACAAIIIITAAGRIEVFFAVESRGRVSVGADVAEGVFEERKRERWRTVPVLQPATGDGGGYYWDSVESYFFFGKACVEAKPKKVQNWGEEGGFPHPLSLFNLFLVFFVLKFS